MKKITLLALLMALFISYNASAQIDKSKRVSPPAKVSQTLKKGLVVSVDYSQPSLRGRTIGKDIVPYGMVWRTGANEATIFEVNKNVKIDGKDLPAGKYSLYTIPNENEWIVIFNKTWNQSGTKYNEADDQLRITVNPEKSESFQEKLTFAISKSGEVSLEWGNTEIDFEVK